MNTYKTTEVARIIGIHPNTVRLYEQLHLIPKATRASNGYRIFTDFHIEQFRLARTALEVVILQNGLRKKALDIIKISATRDFEKALDLTESYLIQLKQEKTNAEEALKITKQLLSGTSDSCQLSLKRKEVSDYLNITMDTLRNWELNGLLRVKRKSNGYRVYTGDDIQRLKIIQTLRCANYSLSAILRMLSALSANPNVDIKSIIDSPNDNEDIITACDKLLISLDDASKNARLLKSTLEYMQKNF